MNLDSVCKPIEATQKRCIEVLRLEERELATSPRYKVPYSL